MASPLRRALKYAANARLDASKSEASVTPSPFRQALG